MLKIPVAVIEVPRRSHTSLGLLCDGRTTTRRRSCMTVGDRGRKTGRAISRATSRPVARPVVWSQNCCVTSPVTLRLVVQIAATSEDWSLWA